MALFFYLLVALAVISFSYVFWTRLREDYTSDQIFSSTIIFLFGGLLGFIIFDRWLPNFSFWGFVLGLSVFGLYAIRKMGIRLLEALDGGVLGFLWFAVFIYLGNVVRTGAEAFIAILPAVVSLAAFYLYFRKYRKFSWYPSGKIGFVAGSIMFLYFTLRALVDFYLFRVLSFHSLILDSLLSLLVSAVFAGVIYLRSGKQDKLVKIFETIKFKKKVLGFRS